MSNDLNHKHILTIDHPHRDSTHYRRKGPIMLMEGSLLCITCKTDEHYKRWIMISPEVIDMLYAARQYFRDNPDAEKWTPPEPEPIVGSNVQVGEFDHKEPS
jgi:hypothetical protein